MAKDPAFLFYHHDFLIGTAFLTFEERGVYITILSHMAAQGGCLSLKKIQVICGTFDASELLLTKFKRDEEGNYFNNRLLEEIQKRKKFTQSRLDNLHMGVHKEPHMVNVNRDRNKDVIKAKKQPIKNNIPPSLEDVQAYCQERKNKVDAQYFIDRNSATGWVDKNGNKYKDWKAVVRTWESWSKATETPKAPGRRPILIVVVELIAAGKTNYEIKSDLIGKYIEKDIDDAIMQARGKKI